MLCLIGAGIWTALPMVLTWTGNIIEWPREKRAISFATVNAIGSLSSVYGSKIWPDWDGPRRVIGFGVTAGFLGFAILLSLALGFLFTKFPHDMYVRRQIPKTRPPTAVAVKIMTPRVVERSKYISSVKLKRDGNVQV